MADEKEVHICKECGSIQVFESAYDKMSEVDKVNLIAQHQAMDFLQEIHDGYDQDHAPLYGTPAEKLQSPEVREKIPVVSDVNISHLQKRLVDFYFRNVKLELAK